MKFPGILLVGTIDGVWQMVDGVTDRVRMTGQYFSALADDRNRTYAATFQGIVLRSRTKGGVWTAWHHFPHPVHSLAVSPHPDRTIYAGMSPARLYRSRDGETWEEVHSFSQTLDHQALPSSKRPHRTYVWSIAFDALDPQQLYAAVDPGGVVRSRDGGKTWERVAPNSSRDIQCLVAHPSQSGVLLAGAGSRSGQPGGVYRSENGGNSWVQTLSGTLAAYVWSMAIDRRVPEVCYGTATTAPPGAWSASHGAEAALFRSLDGGRTWQAISRESGPWPGAVFPVVVPDPHEPGSALVAACPPAPIAALLLRGEPQLPLSARLAHTVRARLRTVSGNAPVRSVGEIWRVTPEGRWERWPETVAPFLTMLVAEA